MEKRMKPENQITKLMPFHLISPLASMYMLKMVYFLLIKVDLALFREIVPA